MTPPWAALLALVVFAPLIGCSMVAVPLISERSRDKKLLNAHGLVYLVCVAGLLIVPAVLIYSAALPGTSTIHRAFYGLVSAVTLALIPALVWIWFSMKEGLTDTDLLNQMVSDAVIHMQPEGYDLSPLLGLKNPPMPDPEKSGNRADDLQPG